MRAKERGREGQPEESNLRDRTKGVEKERNLLERERN